MFKVILFSALLGAACATFPLTYEDIDHSNLGLIDVDEVRPHYMIPAVQSHIPIEFGENDRQVLEDDIGTPLEQLSVQAYPKHPPHYGGKTKHGNYKGSDSSADIKQKKHSYESTKVSQEEIEVKSVNNHYGSRMPQQHKSSGYSQGKRAPSKGSYGKKLEQKRDSAEPGDYSHSIGEKNEPKQTENKHYHHQQQEPVQKHVEPDFKGSSDNYGHHTHSSHAPVQQKHHDSVAQPKYSGHKSAYEGQSSYKMSPKHKQTSYQKPETHGIYREGPKKYPSNHHSYTPKTHHSVEPSRNYHHGVKSHGNYPGPQLHKDSGYKSHGGNLGYHGLNRGSNNHYNHGGSSFNGYHPGHYNQHKHSHQHSTYSSGHMTYPRGGEGPIGQSAGYKNIQSGYGIPRSNSGYHAISGPQYSSHLTPYSGSPSYHHNTHNFKKQEHYPKSIKTSGIKHHLGGSISSGYSRPTIPSGYPNSGSGHRVYTVPLIRSEHQSKKGYSQPKLSQEKHIDNDYSPKSAIGESGYHGQNSPSYHKPPTPHKPNYQVEHHPKPAYGGSDAGHHAPKEYHGIRNNYAKPSYTHNHGGSSGTFAHRPSYPKSHSVKGGSNGYKHSSSSEGNKKYLPVTASHGNNYKSGSSGSPIEQHKYEPSHIEQKDIGHEAVLGGHGGSGGISSGSGYGSNGNSHKYKQPKIEQKDIGYESHLGGHGSPSGTSSGSGYGSSEDSHKYKPSKIEQKDIGYEAHLGGHGSPSGISSGSGHGSSEYKPSKIEQKDISYEGLLGGHGGQDPAHISSGSGYGSSGNSGSHANPSSHEVYGSDDQYEMSKPMPYEFKYEIKDDEHGADQYREEKMDDNGYLTGRYGYKDPHGLYRQVEYEASKAGFKVSSIKTNEPGTENKDPADVHFEVEQNSQPHY
ncbi:Cuticle protein 16.8 like protein [Argiope bruennichi]|uniref:Cuticle protein 16.8 like protein n=1 Tax=Argiope bruennichi TaxID=94029 RepID=A0A8T0EH07_ARGBR|nr:Cuticle protein 16.8 like protein [Argiope bruennichi]